MIITPLPPPIPLTHLQHKNSTLRCKLPFPHSLFATESGKEAEDGEGIVRWWVCEGCGEERKVMRNNGKRGKRKEELDGRRAGKFVGTVIGDLIVVAAVMWLLIWMIRG
jgi:hypothetical protein